MTINVTRIMAGRLTRRVALPATIVAAMLVVSACGSSEPTQSGTQSNGSTAAPKHGGSLTVLEGVPWGTADMGELDPGHQVTSHIYQGYLAAIYGQLFWIDKKGNSAPGLATGYSFERGGKTLVIHLRKGVKFSDGTPFNAKAVVWNFKRDFAQKCSCMPTFPITSFTTNGQYTVKVNMPAVHAPILSTFQDHAWNFIVSPAAVKKLGVKNFGKHPVGAGPFTVASFTPNNSLVLKRNPTYWQKGKPYLDTLKFKRVASDQAAYEALLAGQGQAYENMYTYPLVKEFKQHFTMTQQPASAASLVQLNTTKAPFNDIRAREAIYYATDAALIDKELYDSAYPVVQSFAPEGTLFPEPKVPGYRSYDLAKAKALVKELGGLSITLGYINDVTSGPVTQALQTEWQQAGIKVKLDPQDVARFAQTFQTGNWEAYLSGAGSLDPGSQGALPVHYLSNSPYSGVHDKKLDAMINSGAATVNNKQRESIYRKIAKYISDKAYSPYLWAGTRYQVATKGVQGPGLTTKLPSVDITPGVFWQDVSVS